MVKFKTKVNIRNFDYVNSLIVNKYDENENENGFSLPYIIATTLDDKIIEITEDEDGDYSISRYSISENDETKQEMTLLYTSDDINELFKILYSVFINDSFVEYIYKIESYENEQDLLIYNLAEDTEEYDSNKEYNVKLLSVFNNLLGFTEDNKYWNCDESYILDDVLDFSDVNDEDNDNEEDECEEDDEGNIEETNFGNYNYSISDVKDDLFEKSITIIPSITKKTTNILYNNGIKTILDLCILTEEEFDLLIKYFDRYPIKDFLKSYKLSFSDKVGEYQEKRENIRSYCESNESFREEVVKKEEIEYSKTLKLTSQMELIISSNEKLVNPKISIYRFDNKNEIFGSFVDEKEGKFNYKFLLPNYTIAGEYKFTIIDENIKEEKEYSLQLIKGGIVVKDDH